MLTSLLRACLGEIRKLVSMDTFHTLVNQQNIEVVVVEVVVAVAVVVAVI